MAVQTYKLPGIGPGMPDYTSQQPGTQKVGQVSTLADLAELAARLKSIDTFDRRGSVLWLDDFESSILSKYYTFVHGTGAAIALSTLTARSGVTSVKMTCGATEGDTTALTLYVPFPYLAKMSQEVSFTLDDNIRSFSIQLSLYDGTRGWSGLVEYSVATDIISYVDKDGVHQTLASNISLLARDNLFHIVKLVVDFSTKKYERLLLDSYVYDLSGIEIYSSAQPLAPQLLMINTLESAGSIRSIFLDDLIIKTNEPANLPE